MVGKTISHYKILEKLGAGGMGVVYKAEDTKLKRIVALKFLPQQTLASAEEKRRFVHEAQAAAALNHANICTVYEIDESEGQTFIAMEYVEGQNLKQKVGSSPLKLEETLDIAMQVAQGLHEAHEKGIVHRDIKTANVMTTSKGQVKITDFGLAKLREQTKLTKTGTTMGTAAYMSPEQTQGEEVDQRTDIWSLGVLLYEMLTGKLPFAGDYEQAVMYSILHEEPEPITGLRTGVPMELERIVFKVLEKNPEERYQHADELLIDLQRVQKSLETKSHRFVPSEVKSRGRRWSTSPVLWTTIIVLFGLAGGVLLFYPSKTIPFSKRDWILITDFENLTGEDVFDKSLNTALTVSIEQSSYVNVYSRRRIEQTLKRMKMNDVDRIDEEVGSEIAEREGIKVMLVPSISRLGERYVLTSEIKDVKTGTSLQSHIVQAQGQEEVLSALDNATKAIRQNLGETLASISQSSKPLSKVTTSSLEALKQYSLGIENHRKGNFDEAKLYYENALRIDSTFTAARASLGMIHFEVSAWREGFDREKGKRLLAKVVEHVDNLTDKEKYGILAFYARAVENNLEKAIEYCKMRLALYPEDVAAFNNLGWYYQQMQRYREALPELKRALQIDPYFSIAYHKLNSMYLYNLGEVDSAITWAKRQISDDDEYVWAYDHLGWAYLGKDSLKQAEQLFQKVLNLDPKSNLAQYRLGHTHRLRGKYQKALTTFQKISQNDKLAFYQMGVVGQLLGGDELARNYFKQYRKFVQEWVNKNPKWAYNYIMLGLAYSRLGQTKRGWELAQKAMEIDSTQHFGLAQIYGEDWGSEQSFTFN